MDDSASNNRALILVAVVSVATMVAQHVAGKATRDALFLTYFDVERLPLMMMVSAVASVAGVVLMSRLLGRYGPMRLIPVLFGISAALLLVQWRMIDASPQVASAALYLQVSAINSLLISGFWSVVNERFDPHSGKQVIARLAAAATFGGLAGGVAAKVVSSAADTHAVLLMLALMHVLCGVGVFFVSGGRGGHKAAESPPAGGLLAPLRKSAMIRGMALLALLVATTAAMLDYVLKAEAAAALTDEQLISFFSYFYVAVGLGSFLLQSAVGNRALKWLGLGGTMAAWPLAVMAFGSLTLAMRSLVTATLMRASANLLSNSFFRAGFEVLYTPIPREDKRTGKVMIDVGADRSGDLVGGALVMAILLVPAYSESLLLVVAIGLAAVCLALILVLQRRYSEQLATNLRSGEISASDIEVVDATTARTLATTQQAIDRETLLREIARQRAAGAGNAARPDPAAPRPADPVTEAVTVLRDRDAAGIRRILASREMTPELLGHAIGLLGDDSVVQETLRALRPAASRSAGQLVDALLDPMLNARARRRLPIVLAASDSPMAAWGLVAALRDPDWAVRYRCARALEQIRRRDGGVPMDASGLHAAVEAELRGLEGAGGAGARDAPEPARRLEMMFLLLGALRDPETVERCWRALQGDDRHQRGTALEYLENRLPVEIWDRLRPHLDLARAAAAAGPPDDVAGPGGRDPIEPDETLAGGRAAEDEDRR